jgi:hypothetical protein
VVAVSLVYNPKGIPLTLTAASVNDWVMVQQASTGHVGKMKISTLIAATLGADEADETTATAVGGEVTLNGPDGTVTSEELTDATEYVLTLHNSAITDTSTVNFEAVENPAGDTPEVTDVVVSAGRAVATFTMPSFTGTLAINFSVV